jgi:hypothetical protein
VEDAIKAGADAVQLDYIRYSSKVAANPQHAKDVYQIIKWFKAKINSAHVPMEIDIFGEVSYYPSMHIGQDIKMFADSVDGVNPMVYPSHFWPYQKYSAEPYKTINNSLNALLEQFKGSPPFKIHAFIEAANFHYLRKTSNAEKQKYLLQEIRAVENAKGVSGWYVWSANNVYDNLFQVLKTNKIMPADFSKTSPVQSDKNKIRQADLPKTNPAQNEKNKILPVDFPKINTALINTNFTKFMRPFHEIYSNKFACISSAINLKSISDISKSPKQNLYTHCFFSVINSSFSNNGLIDTDFAFKGFK